jgi:hypothetical protein
LKGCVAVLPFFTPFLRENALHSPPVPFPITGREFPASFPFGLRRWIHGAVFPGPAPLFGNFFKGFTGRVSKGSLNVVKSKIF